MQGSTSAAESPQDAIVRELAERGPFLNDSVDCYTCPSGINGFSGLDKEDGRHKDPANHEPSCLWRRSKALYPNREPAP